MSEHKHIFRPIKEKPNFCWKCGVAEIDGTFYYPSFQFDKLKEQKEKLKEALETIKSSIDFTEQEEGSSYIISQCDKDVIESALKSCES